MRSEALEFGDKSGVGTERDLFAEGAATVAIIVVAGTVNDGGGCMAPGVGGVLDNFETSKVC